MPAAVGGLAATPPRVRVRRSTAMRAGPSGCGRWAAKGRKLRPRARAAAPRGGRPRGRGPATETTRPSADGDDAVEARCGRAEKGPGDGARANPQRTPAGSVKRAARRRARPNEPDDTRVMPPMSTGPEGDGGPLR